MQYVCMFFALNFHLRALQNVYVSLGTAGPSQKQYPDAATE